MECLSSASGLPRRSICSKRKARTLEPRSSFSGRRTGFTVCWATSIVPWEKHLPEFRMSARRQSSKSRSPRGSTLCEFSSVCQVNNRFACMVRLLRITSSRSSLSFVKTKCAEHKELKAVRFSTGWVILKAALWDAHRVLRLVVEA